MALTFSHFKTFDEVADYYARIKPLRGKGNVGKDIRPIGDRRRRYERIAKISANCYALSDGYHFGDDIFPTWNYPSTRADMEKYAPIVWRKLPDGTDQVTIRNGWGPGGHNSRYAFLDRHSPSAMAFRVTNGKQYIRVASLGGLRNAARESTVHYLAKVRTTPKVIHDDYKNRVANNHWMKAMAKFVMLRDDNSALVFRRKNTEWQHVEGTGALLPKPPRVDKEAKAKFKDDINKFFEWGMTMSPLLMLEDRDYAFNMLGALRMHFDGCKDEIYKRYRRVISDEEHPMRLQLWVAFASGCADRAWGFNKEYFVKTVKTAEDLAKVRARYNTFINIELGFINK